MTSLSLTTVGILCTLPALIQPAGAEELSPSAVLLSEMLKLYGDYADAIVNIIDKKSSVEDTTKKIKALTAKVSGYRAKLSDEDKKHLKELMKDPEIAKMLKELNTASAALKKALIEKKYFDSPALQAACEELARAAAP